MEPAESQPRPRETAAITEQRRAHQELERLFVLVQAVNRARALPEICEAALDAILPCSGADRASILFLDSRGVMRFKAWRGLSDGYRRAVEGHSPWNPRERNPHPVCIEDVSQLDPHLCDVATREGIRALGFFPIQYEGRLLGKFMSYYNKPHRFSADELRVAETIASQVAFGVQRRLAAQELKKLVAERTARLREMIAELQQVSYAITHDMRAPLRAMNTFAALMLEELDRPEPALTSLRDSCRRIMTSAGRLDKLILDSLSYTKLVLQEQPLHPVDLGQLLPSLIESYPNLNSGGAQIRIENTLPVVLGEESLLTQCFSNLLGNAVKFVAAGTQARVVVRVEQANERARVIIADNGIGIPLHAQRRLFCMFQRLTDGYEGTGVGLAIVRKVVERMGGTVGVDSEPSQGSRFWVELRLAQPETRKAKSTR